MSFRKSYYVLMVLGKRNYQGLSECKWSVTPLVIAFPAYLQLLQLYPLEFLGNDNTFVNRRRFYYKFYL